MDPLPLITTPVRELDDDLIAAFHADDPSEFYRLLAEREEQEDGAQPHGEDDAR
jgi:hypothetical protein